MHFHLMPAPTPAPTYTQIKTTSGTLKHGLKPDNYESITTPIPRIPKERPSQLSALPQDTKHLQMFFYHAVGSVRVLTWINTIWEGKLECIWDLLLQGDFDSLPCCVHTSGWTNKPLFTRKHSDWISFGLICILNTTEFIILKGGNKYQVSCIVLHIHGYENKVTLILLLKHFTKALVALEQHHYQPFGF